MGIELVLRTLIVYDDFYHDPHAVRARALTGGFEPAGNANYPGRNSIVRYQAPLMQEMFSDLIGERIKPAANSHCGGFRIQQAGESGRQLIHVDLPSMNTRWAAVCYLTPGEHPDSGTRFWQHCATGLDHLPYDTEYLASIGLGGPADLYRFMNTEGTDTALWQQTWSVPFKFNRMIVFQSNLWHSQGELFGNSDETGRLIQTFFFEYDK